MITNQQQLSAGAGEAQNGLVSVWVGAQARSDSTKPADVLSDCP